MDASRELDALVAEKVLRRDMTRPPGFKYPIGLPHYSTEIAAAWPLMERFRLVLLPIADGWVAIEAADAIMPPLEIPHVRDGVETGFIGSLMENLYDYEVQPTAPLAICLAALSALGIELPGSRSTARPPQEP